MLGRRTEALWKYLWENAFRFVMNYSQWQIDSCRVETTLCFVWGTLRNLCIGRKEIRRDTLAVLQRTAVRKCDNGKSIAVEWLEQVRGLSWHCSGVARTSTSIVVALQWSGWNKYEDCHGIAVEWLEQVRGLSWHCSGVARTSTSIVVALQWSG